MSTDNPFDPQSLSTKHREEQGSDINVLLGLDISNKQQFSVDDLFGPKTTTSNGHQQHSSRQPHSGSQSNSNGNGSHDSNHTYDAQRQPHSEEHHSHDDSNHTNGHDHEDRDEEEPIPNDPPSGSATATGAEAASTLADQLDSLLFGGSHADTQSNNGDGEAAEPTVTSTEVGNGYQRQPSDDDSGSAGAASRVDELKPSPIDALLQQAHDEQPLPQHRGILKHTNTTSPPHHETAGTRSVSKASTLESSDSHSRHSSAANDKPVAAARRPTTGKQRMSTSESVMLLSSSTQACSFPSTRLVRPSTSHSSGLNLKPKDKTYQSWVEHKKKLKQLQLQQQQEQQEAKKQAEEERRARSHATFVAWKNRKEETLKERKLREKQQLHAKLLKEKEEQEEKQKKLEESQAMFQSWVKKKQEDVKAESTRHRTLQQQKEDKIKQEKNEKLEEAKKAFQAWKRQKDAELAKEREQRGADDYEDEVNEQRQAEAQRAFKQWLRNKMYERSSGQQQQAGAVSTGWLQDMLPPWLPPNTYREPTSRPVSRRRPSKQHQDSLTALTYSTHRKQMLKNKSRAVRHRASSK